MDQQKPNQGQQGNPNTQNPNAGAERRDITPSTRDQGNMGNQNQERGQRQDQERNQGGISNRENDEYIDIETDTDTDIDVDLDNVGGTE